MERFFLKLIQIASVAAPIWQTAATHATTLSAMEQKELHEAYSLYESLTQPKAAQQTTPIPATNLKAARFNRVAEELNSYAASRRRAMTISIYGPVALITGPALYKLELRPTLSTFFAFTHSERAQSRLELEYGHIEYRCNSRAYDNLFSRFASDTIMFNVIKTLWTKDKKSFFELGIGAGLANNLARPFYQEMYSDDAILVKRSKRNREWAGVAQLILSANRQVTPDWSIGIGLKYLFFSDFGDATNLASCPNSQFRHDLLLAGVNWKLTW